MQLEVFRKSASFTLRMIRLVITLSLLTTVSFAGDGGEELITAQYGGGLPYLAVTEKNKRETGLYLRNKHGEWTAIVLGKITSHPIKGAVLEQLEMSRFDRRYEMMAIVDGTLRIFQINSDVLNPESVIEIGKGDAGLTDLLTNRPVSIFPVNKAEDVSVYQGKVRETTNNDGIASQLVVVSMKQPKSVLGDGVTFAFLVQMGASAEEKELRLVGKPVVLDYQFQKIDEIKRLVSGNKVYSRNLLWSLTDVKPDDLPALKEWKEKVSDSIGKLDGKPVGRPIELPFYDMQKRLVSIPKDPQFVKRTQNAVFTQTFDLLQGNHLVQFAGAREIRITGKLDLNRETLEPLIFEGNRNNVSGHYVLFFVNGELYLGNTETHFVLKLETHGIELPKNLSFLVSKNENGSFYLLVSQEHRGAPSSTDLYRIENDGSRVIEKTKRVAPHFYPENELIQRALGREDHLLFDVDTPPQESLNDYLELTKDLEVKKDLSENDEIYRYDTPIQTDGLSVYFRGRSVEVRLLKNGQNMALRSMEMPDRLSYHVQWVGHEGRITGTHGIFYVFLSTRKGDVELTSVHKLNVSKEQITSQEFVNLTEAFYEQPILAHRVVLHEGNVLFDHKTPRTDSLGDYQNTYVESETHIDVSESSTHSVVERHRKPMAQYKLNDYFKVRAFGTEGRATKPSGIYSVDRQNGDLKVEAIGEPLKRKGKESNKLIASIQTARFEKEKFEAKTAVIALDPTFQQGEELFDFVFSIAGSSRDRISAPSIARIRIGTSIDSLHGYTLIRGKKKGENLFYLLYSLESPENVKDKSADGTYVLPISVEMSVPDDLNKPPRFLVNELGSNKVLAEPLSKVHLEERSIFLKAGYPALVLTPEKNPDSLDFEIMLLENFTRVQPNSSSVDSGYKLDIGKGESIFGNLRQVWRIQGKYSSRPEVKTLDEVDPSVFREELFPEITDTLRVLSDPNEKPVHRVLLVDKSMKNYVKNMIVGRYVYSTRIPQRWANYDPDVKFYLYDRNDHTQEAVLEGIEGIRKERGHPVLVADLADVNAVGAPRSNGSKDPFTVTHMSATTPGSRRKGPDTKLGDDVVVQKMDHMPHLMYLFATSGDRRELISFRDEKRDPKIPTLFVGTPEEWKQTLDALKVETQYGILDQFQIEELGVPNAEARKGLLVNALNRPELRTLGYSYDASNMVDQGVRLTPAQAREKIVDYIVRRAEREANKEKKNVFTSFQQIMNLFTQSLFTDPNLKKRRVIDQQFVEDVFSKVFNIRRNIRNLPKDHHLVQLSKTDDALVRWQEAGYSAPIDITGTVIKVILSKLRHDAVLKVPSSIMLFGESRTGKTYLFETLIKMLGLKLYDFSNPSGDANNDAGAIIISMSSIVSRNGELQGDNEKIFKTAMDNLDHFLTLPRGFEGFILFDDAHQWPDEYREKLILRIRTLLENSRYSARSPFVERHVERPSRNLSIFMTFNPTGDSELLRKHTKYPWDPSRITPLEWAKASLSGNFTMEQDSFFNRWSKILNLSQFPAEAKGPKLIEEVTNGARDFLEDQGKVLLLSPVTAKTIANRYKTLNARDFLSKASGELLVRAESQPQLAPVQILVPTDVASQGNNLKLSGSSSSRSAEAISVRGAGRDFEMELTGEKDQPIEKFIETSMESYEISGEYIGRLHLIKLMLDSFRTHAFEGLVRGLTHDTEIAGHESMQNIWLGPMLRAIGRHVAETDFLPLKELKIDPYEMGARLRVQQNKLKAAIELVGKHEAKNYFPVSFEGSADFERIIDAYIGDRNYLGRKYTRGDALKEVVKKIQADLIEGMKILLRVNSLEILPEPRDWLLGLKKGDPKELRMIGKKFARTLVEFADSFTDSGLATKKGTPQPSIYDITRFYAYAMDKAIAGLPWIEVQRFALKALQMVGSDMSLSQSAGVQHYLFSKYSLLRPTTGDLLMQMILSSPSFQSIDAEHEERLHKRFVSSCEGMLLGPGK